MNFTFTFTFFTVRPEYSNWNHPLRFPIQNLCALVKVVNIWIVESANLSRNFRDCPHSHWDIVGILLWSGHDRFLSNAFNVLFLARLLPQRPRHFAWQHSARISQTYGRPPSVMSFQLLPKQTNTGSTSTVLMVETHWCSPTFVTCGISLDSLMLPTDEAGDFVEILLLYHSSHLRRSKLVD